MRLGSWCWVALVSGCGALMLLAACGRDAPEPTERPAAEEHAVLGGNFTAVSAGGGYSCGLRTDNTIECWGLRPMSGDVRWIETQ